MAKKKAAKRGRPPKPPENVRSVPVQFFVTPAERERIDRLASDEGLGLSEYCRRRALGE